MGIVACCSITTTDESGGYPEPNRSPLSPYSGIPRSLASRANGFTPITPSRFVRDTSETLENAYDIVKTLGTGAFGVVYKAVHKVSGELRAIKHIARTNTRNLSEDKLLHEIDILKHLDHPNIMKIFEFAANKKGYFIISEYIAGGELFDEIAQRKKFSEVDAAYIMRQLLGAISYCHSRNVIHRDLKPENILINSIEDDKINVKIIDFGNALVSPPDKIICEKVGTVYYVAPEILMGNYTSTCDIWSLGVIMYVLLSGKAPFNGRADKDILNSVVKGKFGFPSLLWDSISQEAKDLVKKMLTYEPSARITAIEAYNHPWLKICKPSNFDPLLTKEALINFRSFNAQTRLQRAAMMFIATQLMTKQERDKLQGIFLALDKDGDGKLTHREIANGYVSFFKDKLSAEKEVKDLLKDLSINGDKKINYSEFLLAAANKEKLLTLKNIKEAFSAFDIDKCGYIAPEELKTVLGPGKKYDEKVWKELVAEVDTKGVGKISYEVFENLLMKYVA